MTRNFQRLTESELADELSSLEEQLAKRPGESRVRTLVQNLRVHQIELEMQNRELREAQHALKEARDRYADLYDFAPVGYLTLDPKGVIREINLTGTRMLGKPRSELLGRPFALHLKGSESRAFFRHLSRAFDDDAKTTTELALGFGGNGIRWVLLESVRVRNGASAECRTIISDITERREAERLRRESDDRLALVADNVPVLIAYVDAHRRYVFNNAAYARWFARSLDYIRGRHMRKILGEQAYEVMRPYVDKALQGEETHFETDVPYPRAGLRYISASYIPHKDANGRVEGFFVLINDLSDRRRAERALAEEEDFVSAVLETAGALVVVCDANGFIVRFNRECERVTGYSADEVLGRHFDMFLLPEDRNAVEQIFERLSGGDLPSRHENCWVAKDGTAKLISWSNTTLTDAQGRVTHIVATGVDVTQRRSMEEELRHQERQLRLVTDAVPVLIAYVDRDMRYRFVNAAYRDWYGVDPARMVGCRVEEFVDRRAFEALRTFAGRALEGEEVVFENTIMHRRRGARQVSATLVPDRDRHGGVDGYFSVVVDVTERRRREESERRRLLDAAHADRLSTIGEMTTEIAHELNQPLTAITTTADVCIDRARTLAGGESLAEALGEISAQAHRAAQIIKHLRTFARRREPDFSAVELDRVIENAISLVKVEAQARGVAVETRFDGPAVVEADPVLVEQLIVNLTRNAIEATTASGVDSPRIQLTTTVVDGNVDVIVADNGPGLNGNTMEHLFEPFFTTKPDGMGLGLAICRSVVEAHGGRIWADTSAQGGAEFGFSLRKVDREGIR